MGAKDHWQKSNALLFITNLKAEEQSVDLERKLRIFAGNASCLCSYRFYKQHLINKMIREIKQEDSLLIPSSALQDFNIRHKTFYFWYSTFEYFLGVELIEDCITFKI